MADAIKQATDTFLKEFPEQIAKKIVLQITAKINAKIDETLNTTEFEEGIHNQIIISISGTKFDQLATAIVNNSKIDIAAAPKDAQNLLEPAAPANEVKAATPPATGTAAAVGETGTAAAAEKEVTAGTAAAEKEVTAGTEPAAAVTSSVKGGTRKADLERLKAPKETKTPVKGGTRKAVLFRGPFKIPRRYTRRRVVRGGNGDPPDKNDNPDATKLAAATNPETTATKPDTATTPETTATKTDVDVPVDDSNILSPISNAFNAGLDSLMKQLSDAILKPLTKTLDEALTVDKIQQAIDNAIQANIKAQFNKPAVVTTIETTIGQSLGKVLEADDEFITRMKVALYDRKCEEIKENQSTDEE